MENSLMPQITHEEARRLIDFNADQSLDTTTGSILDAHLNGCTECRRYACELNQLENLLRKMKQNFHMRPTPLQLDQIKHRSEGAAFLDSIMVTRIVPLVAALIAVTIVTWQFLSTNTVSPAIPYTAIPIPTPSTYFVTSTNTNFMLLNCDYVVYQIQAGDTWDNIALQFSVPKETIMEFNGMKEEEIKPATQLKIPACNHTPTVTTEGSDSTVTITPQYEPITPTPG
jgi:LysM repeat protein